MGSNPTQWVELYSGVVFAVALKRLIRLVHLLGLVYLLDRRKPNAPHMVLLFLLVSKVLD